MEGGNTREPTAIRIKLGFLLPVAAATFSNSMLNDFEKSLNCTEVQDEVGMKNCTGTVRKTAVRRVRELAVESVNTRTSACETSVPDKRLIVHMKCYFTSLVTRLIGT